MPCRPEQLSARRRTLSITLTFPIASDEIKISHFHSTGEKKRYEQLDGSRSSSIRPKIEPWMRTVAGSAAELEDVEDEEALPSHRLVVFVSLMASARRVLEARGGRQSRRWWVVRPGPGPGQ
jgi:hypothetical protein